MSAKNCVVIVYPKHNPAYVVVPDAPDTHFSKKDAQRRAAHEINKLEAQYGMISRAEVVETAIVVNP